MFIRVLIIIGILFIFIHFSSTNIDKFTDKPFNYGPDTSYNRLKTTGIIITKNIIKKYNKGFGWCGFGTGDSIPQYYQYILQKNQSDATIYIPYCDFDPLPGLLGKTDCAKSLGY
jgi:hypothetical protein